MDLCGSIPETSIHGYKYFLTLNDYYGTYNVIRKVFIYPLKSKSDIFYTFEKFQKWAERFSDKMVKFIHMDNDLEFINEKFKKFF